MAEGDTTESRTAVRIELLGAPRVTRGGAVLRLPVKKTLALLAYLALEGRATRAKLAALFWGEADNDAARRNLRRELHRLREAGLGECVRSDDEALALAPGVACDATALLASIADNAALPAWRGALMDGFDLAESDAFDAWLAARRDEFARRWAQAAAAAAARAEASGDARTAAGLHAQLIEHDPLQEAHYAAAMRLHYLLGERARALEFFERCRTTLRDELGLEPLPATAALAEQIRAAEEIAPLVARGGARGLAPIATPLVGREGELAQLAAAAKVFVLIEGEPGVGKSRLAAEFARGRGPVLELAGAELGRGAALHGVAEALRAAADDPAQHARLRALPDADRHELARLVPQLFEGELPECKLPPPAGGAAARTRFFAAIASALAALTEDRTLLIDDLHWLDDGSLEAIELLARRLARSGRAAAIVATARSTELADASVANELVLRLERGGLLERMRLAPLDEAGTLQLVRALSGSDRGALFAQRLQHATHGNPYFLLETIRFLFDAGELSLDERGQWSTRHDEDTADYRELPVPPTVQQAVLERVARLGPAARRVLETAALAGDGFALAEVQPATALSDWEALDGLERAAGAHLIAVSDEAVRRYRFGHDLVRAALDRSLGAERRVLIHLRLAESFTAHGAYPARIARHFEAAGFGARAYPHWLAAAHESERVFAYRDAFEMLVHATPYAPDGAARLSLHRQCATLAKIQFDPAAMHAQLDAIDGTARELGDTAAALESLVMRAELANLRKQFADAAAFSQRALADAAFPLAPPDLQHRARVVLGTALTELRRLDEAHAAFEQAQAETSRLRRGQRGEILVGLGLVARHRDRIPESAACMREAAELFGAERDFASRCKAYNGLAFAQLASGQRADAIDTLEAALADAEREHLTATAKPILMNLAKLCALDNQIARAESVLERAERMLAASGDVAAAALLQARRAEVLIRKGELGAALDACRRSIQLYEDNGGGSIEYWPWYLKARVLWFAGDGHAAAQVYESLPRSPAYATVVPSLVALLTTAFRLPADAKAATKTLALLAEQADLPFDSGALAYWRAQAHLAAGEPDEARRLLQEAPQSQFDLDPASILSARLQAATALDEPASELIEQAWTILPATPPLDALELRFATAHAMARLGDEARAMQLAAAQHEALDKLAATLTAEPKIAESLRKRWALAW